MNASRPDASPLFPAAHSAGVNRTMQYKWPLQRVNLRRAHVKRACQQPAGWMLAWKGDVSLPPQVGAIWRHMRCANARRRRRVRCDVTNRHPSWSLCPGDDIGKGIAWMQRNYCRRACGSGVRQNTAHKLLTAVKLFACAAFGLRLAHELKFGSGVSYQCPSGRTSKVF